jgi:hypothetical protein
MGYTKLFNEIIMSTVWREPNHVRLLWITMLALKDRWHVVNASLPGLADSARITLEECQEALKVLSSPDPFSRTKDDEGRRIRECDGGWIILNGEKYRNKMSLDERREYNRIKQREYRERKAKNSKDVKSCVQNGTECTHTDIDTQAEALKDNPASGEAPPKGKSNRFIPPTIEQVREYCNERMNGVDPQSFIDHYTANGWMRGKTKIKDWKACVRTWEKNTKQDDYGKGAI